MKELNAHSEYVARIRPLLPAQYFVPNTRSLVGIAGHLSIVCACYWLLRSSPLWGLWALASLLIGHSMACVLFRAHDLSHGSIIKNPFAQRTLEVLVWGINGIPATLWRCAHNNSHHRGTNTVLDSDRAFRECEATRGIKVFNRLFWPSRRSYLWHPLLHPLILFYVPNYILRHLVTAFLPGETKLPTVTSKPRYTASNRYAIAAEIVFIASYQYGLWLFLGADWHRFLFAAPIPLLITSSIAMAYLWTNHTLNPLLAGADPLASTTSVQVPRWVDWLHDNFSYHTEHHLFPRMNPRYYPAVSQLLSCHYPDRYKRMPFGEAWRQIWLRDEFIAEVPNNTISTPLDGHQH
jgi:fatty acid desaturase